jgi:1,2-diacylglycerol 3-alpha-glucosyltransferase
MERTLSVAVVFHHIGPYHHARLNAATDRLSVTGIQWSAKGDAASGAAVSPARYNKISLFSGATEQYPAKAELRRAFWKVLEQTNPDVVAVNGWNDFGSLIAANCCIRRGIPMVVMSESARQDEHRTWWKEMVKTWIVGTHSAALVGGQRHVDYLIKLGMPVERIFTGYDVVDNSYFARRTAEIRNSELEVRKKYGLPENYFLASGRFIEKKNLPKLIEAYADYVRASQVAGNVVRDLVLLGDGPLRATLNSRVSTLNLHQHVHLPGFKQYTEVPVYYGLAKAFVHASTSEQWGLVVNEAVASGLPVIVSERCGCAPELVNRNGFSFDPYDKHALAGRLSEMASLSDDERKTLSDASYGIAANFRPERFGEGLEQAARMGLDQPRKAALIGRALIIAMSNVYPVQRSNHR